MGENGILNRAKQARDAHRIGNIDDKVKVAVNSAFADGWTDGGLRKIVHANLKKELDIQFGTDGYTLTPNNDDTEEWTIIVEDQKYKVPNDGHVQKVIWVYDKDKEEITNGDETIKIGDYIEYDPTPIDDNIDSNKLTYTSKAGTITGNGGSTNSNASEVLESGNGGEDATYSEKAEGDYNGYEGRWRICGINENTGEIRIIPEEYVTTIDGYDFCMQGLNGVINGVTELNNICKIYGYGYGASTTTPARSINKEDINVLTGYNPRNVGVRDTSQTGTGIYYDKGNLTQYENEITYYWKGTRKYPKYISNVNSTEQELTFQHTTFNWMSNTWQAQFKQIGTGERTDITTLKSNYYSYYAKTLTQSSSGTEYNPKGTSIYSTLFGNDDLIYWVADNYILPSSQRVEFGIMKVDCGWINNGATNLYASDGENYVPCNSEHEYGYIRPVVTLKYDVELKQNGTIGNINNWKIN